MTDVAAVRAQAGVSGAAFGFFRLVRPGGSLRGGLRKALCLLLQLFMCGPFEFVAAAFVFQKRGAIPPFQLDAFSADGQNVIHAAIQKGPVVRNQKESPLAAQVTRRSLSSLLIEVIGRLVNQQKTVFL